MAHGKRIALFGGTFDPVHSAHVTVAREARENFALDEVLFVPASRPPHKTSRTGAGYEDRCRMVELACRGHAGFRLSRLEQRPGKSFTLLTVEKLRAGLDPGDRLFFLIGSDAFADLESWYRWQELVTLVEFIVATRPDHDYLVPAGATVHRLETVALPVSSSDIRAALAAGGDPAELPAAVAAYIRENKLYL